jgi:ADP-ribose pyrophosphatase YjhB (NUDIX family)
LICVGCGFILYENPKVLVTCLATWEDKLLWMRRAREPQRGGWTIPGGFMEKGETPEQAAARELHEETGGLVDPAQLSLWGVGAIPGISEVYLAYRGRLIAPTIASGPEAMDVGLFGEHEAPWKQSAYPQTEESLRQFYREHARGEYDIYTIINDYSERRFNAVKKT